jgi:hypothetical protein
MCSLGNKKNHTHETEEPLGKTVWKFIKKLKIGLLYDLAVLLLGICPKEIKLVCQRDSCTSCLCITIHSSQDLELAYVSISG